MADQLENCFFITKNAEFTQQCGLKNFAKLFVILFYAEWQEFSQQLIQTIQSLSTIQTEPHYLFVDVEKVPEMTQSLDIQVIPTVIFCDSNKKVLLKLENPAAVDISDKIDQYLDIFRINFETQKKKIFDGIDLLLNNKPVHVLIKGTPDAPKCKFSTAFVNILAEYKVKYTFSNILENEELRNWMRLYANWNTYPQLWINQKLVGGLDSLKALVEQNQFESMIPLDAKIQG